MCDELYRHFERALAGANRLAAAERTRFLRLAAWWVAWAEELIARVPYVYLDYRIWVNSWPTGQPPDAPPLPVDTSDEMTRT